MVGDGIGIRLFVVRGGWSDVVVVGRMRRPHQNGFVWVGVALVV